MANPSMCGGGPVAEGQLCKTRTTSFFIKDDTIRDTLLKCLLDLFDLEKPFLQSIHTTLNRGQVISNN